MRIASAANRLSPGAARRAGGLVSAVCTAVLVALVLRADWQELVRPLAGASLGWLAAAIGLALSVEAVKTVRWQLLLGMAPRLLPRMLALMFHARLLNALVPLRAGDVWRVALASRIEERPVIAAGASVVAEKVLDGAALGATTAFLVWTFGTGERGIGGLEAPSLSGARFASTWLPWALVALCLAAGVALALGSIWSESGQRAIHAAGRAGVRAVKDCLVALRGWRLFGAAALTAGGLGLGLLVNLTVLEALGLWGGLIPGLIILVSGYAVGLVPAGPGQLGVYELAVAAPLMAAGFPPASSIAAAVALHLVLLTALGLGGLLAVPLGLKGPLGRR